MSTQPSRKRILIFSQRNVFARTLFRCSLYEFENVISEIDSVDFLAPHANPSSFRYITARQLAYHTPIALSPDATRVSVKGDYDVFLAICGSPVDLLMLNTVNNWRDHCKTAVCLIDELWIRELHAFRRYLGRLNNFDVVKLYYSNTVKPLSERIASKCAYLSPGVDAIRFCPYPHPPQRVVDVLSVGRRSETTHRALLRMADKEGLFYLHDTIAGGEALNANDHRAITRNLAKRSRYFIVNPGLIDRPDIRGSQIEIGNRYFEGSAAGAILLGERPENEVFGKLFDWPDALVRLPYDSPKVDEIIHELDLQPERQEMIRRMNVAQALLRHDWVYRWESILESVNLEPLPQLLERKNRLRSLADTIMPAESAAPCARF